MFTCGVFNLGLEKASDVFKMFLSCQDKKPVTHDNEFYIKDRVGINRHLFSLRCNPNKEGSNYLD